jgi:hypothetical protein
VGGTTARLTLDHQQQQQQQQSVSGSGGWASVCDVLWLEPCLRSAGKAHRGYPLTSCCGWVGAVCGVSAEIR